MKLKIDPVILQTLEEETIRNGRALSLIRVIAISAWFLLSLYFGRYLGQEDWAKPIYWLDLYLIVSILLFFVSRTGKKRKTLLNWTSVIADLPFVFISMKIGLSTAPYPLFAVGFTFTRSVADATVSEFKWEEASIPRSELQLPSFHSIQSSYENVFAF